MNSGFLFTQNLLFVLSRDFIKPTEVKTQTTIKIKRRKLIMYNMVIECESSSIRETVIDKIERGNRKARVHRSKKGKPSVTIEVAMQDERSEISEIVRQTAGAKIAHEQQQKDETNTVRMMCI
jgi:hypothetical protein